MVAKQSNRNPTFLIFHCKLCQRLYFGKARTRRLEKHFPDKYQHTSTANQGKGEPLLSYNTSEKLNHNNTQILLRKWLLGPSSFSVMMYSSPNLYQHTRTSVFYGRLSKKFAIRRFSRSERNLGILFLKQASVLIQN